MKKFILLILILASLTGCTKTVPSSKYDSVKSDLVTLQEKYDDLEKQFTELKSEYDQLENNNILQNIIDDAAKTIFADAIVKNIGLDYSFNGTLLYDGVGQINILSENDFNHDFPFITKQFTNKSNILITTMDTYNLNILYVKIVDASGYTMFEYTYTKNDVKIAVGLDYIDLVK